MNNFQALVDAAGAAGDKPVRGARKEDPVLDFYRGYLVATTTFSANSIDSYVSGARTVDKLMGEGTSWDDLTSNQRSYAKKFLEMTTHVEALLALLTWT